MSNQTSMTGAALAGISTLLGWPSHEHGPLFAGPWVGETMGCASPAHIWEIEVRSMWLTIRSRWEGESQHESMSGRLIEGEGAFTIGKHKAVLLGSQHFVIRKWDTNDMRGGKGAAYDVIFSRPGIAELSAHDVYRRFKRAR